LENANSNGKDLFACFAQTDGYSISLQFARKRQDKYSKALILALEDFNRTEVEENFLPCTIDPGRKQKKEKGKNKQEQIKAEKG
jgi:hypothetical protein